MLELFPEMDDKNKVLEELNYSSRYSQNWLIQNSAHWLETVLDQSLSLMPRHWRPWNCPKFWLEIFACRKKVRCRQIKKGPMLSKLHWYSKSMICDYEYTVSHENTRFPADTQRAEEGNWHFLNYILNTSYLIHPSRSSLSSSFGQAVEYDSYKQSL